MILHLCLTDSSFLSQPKQVLLSKDKSWIQREQSLYEKLPIKKKNPTITILHVIQQALERCTQWNYFSPLILRYKMIKIRTCEENFTTVLWNLPAMGKYQNAVSEAGHVGVYHLLHFIIYDHYIITKLTLT